MVTTSPVGILPTVEWVWISLNWKPKMFLYCVVIDSEIHSSASCIHCPKTELPLRQELFCPVTWLCGLKCQIFLFHIEHLFLTTFRRSQRYVYLISCLCHFYLYFFFFTVLNLKIKVSLKTCISGCIHVYTHYNCIQNLLFIHLFIYFFTNSRGM